VPIAHPANFFNYQSLIQQKGGEMKNKKTVICALVTRADMIIIATFTGGDSSLMS
jgi:hypothetical protein